MRKGLAKHGWGLRLVVLLGMLWVFQVQAGTTIPKVTVKLIVTNAQGTVVATMTPQGDVTYTAAYRPYGQQVEGTPQAGPGYTGHVNDPDSGLVYMQQRYYDQDIGRFPSPDPIGPTPGNIYSFNRYAYANGNPIGNIDPTGMSPDDSHSSSSCGSDIPPATCKQIRQQQKENERIRAFGGSVIVLGDTTSRRSKSEIYMDKYFSASSVGNWTQALSYGLKFIGASWSEAFSSPTSGVLTAMSVMPGIGIEASADRALLKDTVVLGHYPGYVNLARRIGAKYHSVPMDVWEGMSNVERWAANVKFLDRAASRRSLIILSTRPSEAVPGSIYVKELEHLAQKGYTVSGDETMMYPPGVSGP